jgi:hypothetical protein
MKKETEFEKLALSQIPVGKSFGSNYAKSGKQFVILPAIFLRNRITTTDCLCKGPPGSPLSAGSRGHPDHPPDSVADPPDDRLKPVGREKNVQRKVFCDPLLKPDEVIDPAVDKPLENRINTEYQIITNNKNSIYYKHLIFKIMKKQILFLAFLFAAVFAGTNAFGQLSDGSPDLDHLDAIPSYCAPYVPLTCGAGDPLAPMPGVSYPYTVSSTSVGTLRWFVTDEATLVSAQGTIAAAIEPKDGSSSYILTADGAYNDPANTSATVNITWKSFDGDNNNVILVVYNVDDANCTDNMEVYRIKPKYGFTLDIAGIADAGDTGGNVSDCVNPIQTASYNGTDLTVDYGIDYVYFAVNAANWMNSWMPDKFAVATDGTSAVSVDGWAYPADAATGGAWNAVGTDPVLATAYPAGISDNGFVAEACIIVRVKVDHNTTTENIAAETINLTVNGEMASPVDGTYAGYPDLDEGGAGNACTNDLVTDAIDYVITPRPTVTADAATGTFENKVP